MLDLAIDVTGSEPDPFAAVPTLLFHVRVSERSGLRVHAMAIRTQVRIEPQRRMYSDVEEEGLVDLFGTPSRWAETRRPFLWAELATVIPSFDGSTDVDLAMPCSYDFEVSANRYMHALWEGEVPLVLLFSGTVFGIEEGRMSVSPIPWHLDRQYRLPVAQWQAMMDRWFPGSGWLRLDRRTIDALGRYKAAQALPSWDAALTLLLDQVGEAS